MTYPNRNQLAQAQIEQVEKELQKTEEAVKAFGKKVSLIIQKMEETPVLK